MPSSRLGRAVTGFLCRKVAVALEFRSAASADAFEACGARNVKNSYSAKGVEKPSSVTSYSLQPTALSGTDLERQASKASNRP
jgi:hypothetical protein